MMRGIRPPISVGRRAGLQTPQMVTKVRWDGLVPAEHAQAFAHKLLTPLGRPVVARWHPDTLYHPAGGGWWVEHEEGARTPKRLSEEGWDYVGPLWEDAATAETIAPGSLRSRIRTAIAREGTADAWAKRRGISPSYVSDVLSSRCPIGDRLLAAVSVVRREVFVVVASDGEASAPVQAMELLSRDARRALLWLPEDGSPRDRRVRDGDWRPGRAELLELRTLLLVEERSEGWVLIDDGIAARAALVARNEGSESR
jgi:hypothetical protein